MSTEVKQSNNLVAQVFKEMSYSPPSESFEEAKKWLKDHDNKIGFFCNGEICYPLNCSVAQLCGTKEVRIAIPSKDDVNETLSASQAAYLQIDDATNTKAGWSVLSSHERAVHLYNIARSIQKHQKLFMELEILISGKTKEHVKDVDIPHLIQSFYNYAGWAEIFDPVKEGYLPYGIISVIDENQSSPLMMCWRIAPILATKNTVVLMPECQHAASCILFAELCTSCGIPPGVVSVLPYQRSSDSDLSTLEKVYPSFLPRRLKEINSNYLKKIIFTGSAEAGEIIRSWTESEESSVTLDIGGRTTMIILESSDICSAAEGAIEALKFQDIRSCTSGCRVLVQENILESFVTKLQKCLNKVSYGNSACDIRNVLSLNESKHIEDLLKASVTYGCKLLRKEGERALSILPAAVLNVQPASPSLQEKHIGPVILVTPFRTAKEAIALCNNSCNGITASIWSEKLTVALEVAHLIECRMVWINCQNKVDAEVGLSGSEGGKNGLYEYLHKAEKHDLNSDLKSIDYSSNINTVKKIAETFQVNTENEPLVDETLKMYYAGGWKRASDNSVYSFNITPKKHVYIPKASSDDVHKAVEAAVSAKQSWKQTTSFNRSQILYFVAENLQKRKKEFIEYLNSEKGAGDEVEKEQDRVSNDFDSAVSTLFYWAACCNKHGGTVKNTHLYGNVIKINEPVGVVAIFCNNNIKSLLSFISVVAPAVAMGNVVVVAASEAFPLTALNMCQVFHVSDIPKGVINVLTGCHETILKQIISNGDVQSIWHHKYFLKSGSSMNFKNYWLYKNQECLDDFHIAEILCNATRCKTIWMPMGDIFAN